MKEIFKKIVYYSFWSIELSEVQVLANNHETGKFGFKLLVTNRQVIKVYDVTYLPNELLNSIVLCYSGNDVFLKVSVCFHGSDSLTWTFLSKLIFFFFKLSRQWRLFMVIICASLHPLYWHLILLGFSDTVQKVWFLQAHEVQFGWLMLHFNSLPSKPWELMYPLLNPTELW